MAVGSLPLNRDAGNQMFSPGAGPVQNAGARRAHKCLLRDKLYEAQSRGDLPVQRPRT